MVNKFMKLYKYKIFTDEIMTEINRIKQCMTSDNNIIIFY